MKSKEYIALQQIVGNKTISFQPAFARALGSVSAGLFLSQGFFWQFNAQHVNYIDFEGRMYFSRTAAEWEAETALTDEQQKRARRTLIGAKILREKLAGVPARMYYNFDFEAMINLLNSFHEVGKPVSTKHGIQFPQNTETSSRKSGEQASAKHGNRLPQNTETIIIESIESNINIEAQAPFFENEETETLEADKKNTPPNSAPPPLKKRGYTKQDVSELLPVNLRQFYESILNSGTWGTYLDYRKQTSRFKYKTAQSEAIAIRQFYAACFGSTQVAQAVVDQTISRGWAGLFPLKTIGSSKSAVNNNQGDYGAPQAF